MRIRVPKLRWLILATVVVLIAFVTLTIGVPYYRTQRLIAEGAPHNQRFSVDYDGPPWFRKWADGLKDGIGKDLVSVFKTRVTSIWIDGPYVDDDWLSSIQHHREIEILTIDSPRATGACLAHLRGMKKLYDLCLFRAKIRGSQLTELADLQNLERLAICEGSLDDECLRHLSELPQIRYLAVCDNRLSETAICQIPALPLLTEVVVEAPLFGDRGLTDLISKNPQLESLSLRGTQVTDAGILELKKLHALNHLDLSSTLITDAALGHLADVKWLARGSLTIDKTNITDRGLEELRSVANLQHIFALESKFTSAGVKKLREARPDMAISVPIKGTL